MRIERRFTRAGQDPYAGIEFTSRDSRITNPDGSVVFEMRDDEVPTSWSQVAADIMVSKYFRKPGVPQVDERVQARKDKDGKAVTGPERSAWLELTLREGRSRQVRRMTAAVGLPTLRLVRDGIGPWRVEGLAPGEWREVSRAEAETALGAGRLRMTGRVRRSASPARGPARS